LYYKPKVIKNYAILIKNRKNSLHTPSGIANFRLLSPIFAAKRSVMEKIMDDYAAFERAMDRDKVYLDLDFDEICSAIGADKKVLDQLISKEIGMSGRELVDFYRSKFG
jgi:hypothetical protein